MDIAVGSPEARFGFPEAAIGLVPGQILPFVAARLGSPAARRLVLTGRRIDAAEAHRIGLLDYVADSHPATRQVRWNCHGAAGPRPAPRHAGWLPVALLQASAGAAGLPGRGAAELFAGQMRSEAMEASAARESGPLR